MIPVELFGIHVEMCERFYDELPGLVSDAFEDKEYVDSLFKVETERSLKHLNIADAWANNTPLVWNEDLENEVMMALRTCLLYTSPSPRDATLSRMPSSA